MDINAVFISYRRADSAESAGRIYDRLVERFSEDRVFKDVDSIQPGVAFADYIVESIGQSAVALVIIGPRWLTISTGWNRRRLDDPTDFVRIEIATALRQGVPVIPVLVMGAAIPPAHRLPDSLRRLVERNAIQVRPDPDFRRDMDRVIAAVEYWMEHPQPTPASTPESPTPIHAASITSVIMPKVAAPVPPATTPESVPAPPAPAPQAPTASVSPAVEPTAPIVTHAAPSTEAATPAVNTPTSPAEAHASSPDSGHTTLVEDVIAPATPASALPSLRQLTGTVPQAEPNAPTIPDRHMTPASPAVPVSGARQQVKRLFVGSGVTLLLLLAVVVASVVGRGLANARRNGNEGQFSANTQTPFATATATLEPTSIPSPTPTHTPKPTQPQFNARGWVNDQHCFLGSDGYHVKDVPNGSGSWLCLAPLGNFGDATISVQLKQIPAQGGTSGVGGLVFRTNTSSLEADTLSSGYELWVNTSGLWQVSFGDGGGTGYVSSSAIHKGYYATNTLEVRSQGSHFDILMNGTQIGQVDNSTYASGKVGLFCGSWMECVFTNLEVSN